MVNIKNLSNSKLKSSLNYIYNSKRPVIDGHDKTVWVVGLKRELDRRKRIENHVIDRLPYVKELLNKLTYSIRYKDERFMV